MTELHTFSWQRRVDAPPSVVWEVMTDHDLYGEVAPNLASVEVIEGEAEELVRRCVDTDGNDWTESCLWWAPGEGFAMAVDVADSAFHRRLFTRFEGEWRLAETADRVEVTMTFRFEPRYGPFGRLIAWYFAYRAPGIVDAILDRWERAIEARQERVDQRDRRANVLYR